MPALANAGIKVASIAGNHTMDYGPEAFSDTLDNLHQYGIKSIGGGRTIEEARTPAVFNIDGTRVAFLGYNSIIKPEWIARKGHPGMAPPASEDLLRTAGLATGNPGQSLDFSG